MSFCISKLIIIISRDHPYHSSNKGGNQNYFPPGKEVKLPLLAGVHYKPRNRNLHALFTKELTLTHERKSSSHGRQHTPTSGTFLVAEQQLSFIFKSLMDLKEKQFFPHKMSKNNHDFPVQLGI